ncbi:MAG: urate hydroxylase PuuD [Minicystis sp.]
MEALLQEWLNVVIRLVHVIAAIMWIGDSFLFMFLDRSLVPPTKPREGDVMGEMWMTHGGGFYELVKRRSLTQAEMPETLHWFKWESYTTWMSGFTLLIVVYYMTGGAFLIDPHVAAIKPAYAIHLSLLVLVVGWLVYDTLCRVLLKHTTLLAAVCFGFVVAVGYALTRVFSPRAAFIHVGALMATCMSANVFFHIIPGQKRMLADTLAGRPVDTTFGVKAKTRSTHNHYITLPVLLTMLSNHFPSLYGHKHAWVILALLFVFGAGLKLFMNYKQKTPPLALAATVGALAGIVIMTAPRAEAKPTAEMAAGPEVPFARVWQIVQTRCVTCHAEKPLNGAFPAPPAGVALDTPEAVHRYAQRIFVRAVHTHSMPQSNMTAMTEEERAELGRWIAQGAVVGPIDAAPAQPQITTGGATGSDPEAAKRAKNIYNDRCVICHGAAGGGDGPTAAGLTPKPRNFSDAAWQSAKTDDAIGKAIVGGGQAVGLSPLMPPNPDLEKKPEVLAELVKVVRGFKR